MNIYAISDLHLDTTMQKPMDIFGEEWIGHWDKIKLDWTKNVTDDDIVLLAGDYSWAMKLEQVVPDINLLSSLPGKKILIKGNHDYWWSGIGSVRKILPENVYCIQNDAIKIGEYIICGTRGWNIPVGKYNTGEDRAIHNRELIRLRLTLDSAEKLRSNNEKIILMMHYPPYMASFVETDYVNIIDEYNVDKVIFGHLHHATMPMKKDINDTEYLLTSCSTLGNKLLKIF